jgi:predicted nucleotidyltransferase component of viral defense system
MRMPTLYPLVDVPFATLDEEGELFTATARSYDINEMLGTKTRALMQREQGRDLFDLVHARLRVNAQPALANVPPDAS